jgi:D-glycero-D-manno-heptose 1,7-bisphosphate phosphatase
LDVILAAEGEKQLRDWPYGKSAPRQRRAVFLDRDGTINVDTHFPHRREALEFIPNAMKGLKVLTSLPLDIIVVANQAGIALGIFTRQQMSEFNAELRSQVEAAGARIDAFYFCPHLEPKHLKPGETACNCSKPAPGMLLEAAQDFEIDLAASFLIGDKTSDIASGEAVGCVTILVNSGKAGQEERALPVHPTHTAADLYEAALIVQDYITRESSSQRAAIIAD